MPNGHFNKLLPWDISIKNHRMLYRASAPPMGCCLEWRWMTYMGFDRKRTLLPRSRHVFYWEVLDRIFSNCCIRRAHPFFLKTSLPFIISLQEKEVSAHYSESPKAKVDWRYVWVVWRLRYTNLNMSYCYIDFAMKLQNLPAYFLEVLID